jgi:hypothetical protein
MMSVTRYSNGISPDAVQNRMREDSSRSFSSSFAIAGRFGLAVNTVWATLVVAACVTVALRLRIINSWPFIALAVLFSTGLVLAESVLKRFFF